MKARFATAAASTLLLTAALVSPAAAGTRPAAVDAPTAAACAGTLWKVGVQTSDLGTDRYVYLDFFRKANGYSWEKMVELDNPGDTFQEDAYDTFVLCEDSGLVPWKSNYSVVLRHAGYGKSDWWTVRSVDVQNLTTGEEQWHYQCEDKVLGKESQGFEPVECAWVS
ncbi:hypothetical protein LUW75_09105 [Streptomyces sp. MRC013]|uniref:PLAT/LH2 domain-containing protein n=1 Tax=Streptomyces sp. MRC013 TaxID=2898276 RepID=UPI0020272EB1|nr:PLAT/LH2 domain-containing protein [Streptomyces sp. MRC013]URM90119.1 hypothetical protein LUW75_09105 [Streptomyces sp. MRC013]